MNKLENSIHDNANGLDYTLVNDHYLPNLTAAAPAEQHPIGRWGRLHKKYLHEQSRPASIQMRAGIAVSRPEPLQAAGTCPGRTHCAPRKQP